MLTHVERPLTALDAIFTRRSVREYTPQRLDRQTVRALLEAAVQAPMALQTEPWAFIVVQDPATLKRYSDRAKAWWLDVATAAPFAEQLADPHYNVFHDATTLIVICGKGDGPYVVPGCWLAAENLMIAACAMGLGTCCIGSAVPALNAPDVKVELGVPPEVAAVAPIVAGVPRERAKAVPRRSPEILSWT